MPIIGKTLFPSAALFLTAKIVNIESGSALLVIERTTWIGVAPITLVKAYTAPRYELFDVKLLDLVTSYLMVAFPRLQRWSLRTAC